MMTVSELIIKLSEYAALSPENGSAEVMLGAPNEVCWEMAGANDARGVPGNHYLICIPNLQGKRFAVKDAGKIQ